MREGRGPQWVTQDGAIPLASRCADYERLDFLRVLRSHEAEVIADPGGLILTPEATPMPHPEELSQAEGGSVSTDTAGAPSIRPTARSTHIGLLPSPRASRRIWADPRP